MIVDHIRNRALYYSLGEDFRKALDYLATVPFTTFEQEDMPLGDSASHIMACSMTTRLAEQASFEAHRRFADIHYVVCGQEQIRYTDLANCTEVSYDADGDLAMLAHDGDGDAITLAPGYFLIALPQDAHKPCLAIGEPAPVWKMIGKIAL